PLAFLSCIFCYRGCGKWNNPDGTFKTSCELVQPASRNSIGSCSCRCWSWINLDADFCSEIDRSVRMEKCLLHSWCSDSDSGTADHIQMDSEQKRRESTEIRRSCYWSE